MGGVLDKQMGKHVVPIVPDEARTFGMDALFKVAGIYSPDGQRYTPVDAELCLRQFVNVGYNRKLMIAKGVELTFIDAGHILGSAQVILDIEDEDDGQKKRLLFSGDVGRGDNDLLRDPVAAEGVDYL